jgi:methyl-accepting chemotaxis protein
MDMLSEDASLDGRHRTLSLFAALHLRWKKWRLKQPENGVAATTGACDAVAGMRDLDDQVAVQLGRAVDLSEQSAVQFIQRVSDLRALSADLIRYLDGARQESEAMQQGVELNSRIVAELAAFVQTLPEQIVEERRQFDGLLGAVKGLSEMTDSIRAIARQTEILAINAAIEAAHAGETGRTFGVLAGEVRRLAARSNESGRQINDVIARLVQTVEVNYSVEFESRTRHNQAEAERLGGLTQKLDDSYVDMRQFYQQLLGAVTGHNEGLDQGLGRLLDTAQNQDVLKQIVDRARPAIESRNDVMAELIARLRAGDRDTADIDGRALALAGEYLELEAAHRDPDVAAEDAPGAPGARIELF